MRYTFLFLLLSALLFSEMSSAQAWTAVGSLGFSAGQANFESIAVDKSGTPYVVYQDIVLGGRATVMKYDGTSWVAVGSTAFSGGVAGFTSIAMDNGGTPYVVFQDGADTSKVTVMKYDGSSWVNVGTPGFSAGLAGLTCIAFDTFNTPYVAFEDDSFPVGSGPVSVMKYNGTKWAYVGSPRFTAGAQYLAFAMSAHTPYVVFQDSGNGFKASVMKFDGSNWVSVGAPGFSAGLVQGVSIAVKNDTPFVSYTDDASSNKATTMKYNGSSWVNVGMPGFTPAEADYVNIVIDSASGIPYVAYSDVSTTPIAVSVMKYNGTAWVNVGSVGFTGTLSNYVGLAIDRVGTPYVCYQGFTGGKKASVMKYNAPLESINAEERSPSLTVFPDPNNGAFRLMASSPQNEEASVIITNMLGQVVEKSLISTNSESGLQIHEPPGVYLITVTTRAQKMHSRLVVE